MAAVSDKRCYIMARSTRPLTNTEVKQAKPKAKEYNLADGGGLALKVKPSGSKNWVFNYIRPFLNKRTNIGFGTYPAVSLLEARKLRDEARSLLAKNIDPKEHRDKEYAQQEQAYSNTLEAVATAWFEIKKSSITENYAEGLWRSLELHVFPTLGKTPIHKLEAPQVIKALEPISAKGSLETVKRVIQRLNEVMVYAVNTGIIKANPLTSINKAFKSPKVKNMPTLRPEQLPELMQAVNQASIKRTTKALLEWQLHTITRPSEAAGTKWAEIDFENQLWLIPAARMKKNREHKVPLSPQALALLEYMKPISGHREHVFPADRNPKQHTNSQTVNMALKRMGYAGQLVSHGLRALASTTLNEQGFDPDVIETALAHVDSNEVRAAYNRSEYLEKRRVMLEWWSDHIEQAATGNTLSTASNVINLRG